MCNAFFFLFFPLVLGTWPHTLCSIATEVFEPVESRGMFNFNRICCYYCPKAIPRKAKCLLF